MRIPVSWIKQYIKYEVSNERIAELLTMAGTEVSEIIKFGDNWDENIIVGEITKIEKHPDADRLSLVEVNDSKNLFKKNNWPTIDVTRKSVEETAASILKIIEIKKKK